MPKRFTIHDTRYTKDFYAIILVGGKGKRLRPLSSDSRPKAFLSVTGDRKTMFRKTLDRAGKIVPKKNIVIVANRAHAGLVWKDFPELAAENLILEPCSRNTAPAITLAASMLAKRDEDAVAVVLPTDQYIADEKRYIDSVKRAVNFAKDNGRTIVVMGVEPKSPSVELGYIRVKRREAGSRDVLKVEKFAEKPDLDTAKKYVDSGRYLWNTGAFIFNIAGFLSEVRKLAPKIYAILKDPEKFEERYGSLPDVSVDHAIIEKARSLYCVKGRFGWFDMGSFENLARVLRRESRRFMEKDGKIVRII